MTTMQESGMRPWGSRAARAARAALWGVLPTLLTYAVFQAGTALAAEDGEAAAGNPWLGLLWKAINFVVLVALLYYFARKPVRAMLVQAAERLKHTVEGSRTETRVAEQELAEQKRKIDGLQAELASMIDQTRKDAEEDKRLLSEEALAQAERIKTQMLLQIEQEFAKATSELKAQIADEMVRKAEEMIRKELDGKADARIVDAFIAQLEERR
jgi:F-type H+-transporting ATPase subunit b